MSTYLIKISFSFIISLVGYLGVILKAFEFGILKECSLSGLFGIGGLYDSVEYTEVSELGGAKIGSYSRLLYFLIFLAIEIFSIPYSTSFIFLSIFLTLKL